MGFPPEVRLHKPAEFKLVFAEGKRCKRRLLAASVRGNARAAPRLGLAIAKKSVASACARNRIKRLIRDDFRHRRPRLPAVDLVFYAQPGLAELSNAALRSLLAELWTQVIERCAPYSSAPCASINAA